MPSNPGLYRFVDFLGASILDAQNLLLLEAEALLRDKQGIGTLYADGTLLNAAFSIVGGNITLICSNTSYPVWVFVRGTFEQLIPASSSLALPTLSLSPGSDYSLFLNWSLDIKTSSDDPTFVDGTTGEPTIEVGQLNMGLSWTDTSGVALNPLIQFEKNSTRINPVTFSTGSGAVIISTSFFNGVFPYVLANTKMGGLVNLTDDSGTAVGTTDSRLSDARNPLNHSVHDISVANLVITDGTTSPVQYDPAAGGQGGIFTEHIIYNTLKQKLTDFLDGVSAAINAAIAALAAHIGQPLGSVSTHPFPTAAQVGAAPASHVGQVLGLSTSHPAQVNQDHTGFTVLRNPAISPGSTDYGYQITDGTTVKAALTHGGDIFSILANAINASGGNGTGGTAVNTGNLGLFSFLATVLSEHIGYRTHGSNNPHNLNASDIGAASTAYVDNESQSVLSAAIGYTDIATSVLVRKVTVVGPTSVISFRLNAEGGLSGGTDNLSTVTYYFGWTIFTFGNKFEIAFGDGTLKDGDVITLPPSDAQGSWSASNLLAGAGMSSEGVKTDLNSPAWSGTVASMSQTDDGSGNFQPTTVYSKWISSFGVLANMAHVSAVAWRSITAAPIIIQAFDNTSGTTNSGHVGNTVTITGRNFGISPTLTFNGVSATIGSSSPTQIVCTVPSTTTGLIAVTAGSQIGTSAFVFTVS